MPPVVAAAAVSGAAILGSTYMAADAQKKAARRAERAQAPYREAGLRSLKELQGMEPGGEAYQWRRQEEEGALESRMRAAGTYKSGRSMELFSRLGQSLTAGETQAHEARQMSIAKMGSGGDTSAMYAQGQAAGAPWLQGGMEIAKISGSWADAQKKKAEDEKLAKLLADQAVNKL